MEKMIFVRFKVSTAVTIQKVVFWDVALCRYCVNQRFGAPVHAGSSLADFLLFSSTLKIEAIRSSETSVNTQATRRHIQEFLVTSFERIIIHHFDIYEQIASCSSNL
jgi:hypothetical protein